MKIFIPVLTLFSASMALGSTLDKCKSELKEYSGCIFDYTKISSSKLNQYCNTFYSSKCQNYINKPEKYVPSCFSLDNSYRIDDLILLNYKKALLDLICQNDSQGNRCSISEIFFGKDVKSSSNVKKIIEATCKQSNCRNKYIEFLDAKYKLGNSGDKNKYEISSINLSNISQMKKYMQSNECVGKGSSTTTKVNKTTSRNIPISTVKGRCGPAYGACSVEGECCSKHNYCGTSTEHCGTGCQIGYGICSSSNLSPNTTTTTKKATTTKNKTTIKGSTTTVKKSTTTLRSVSTVSGRCGPEYGACAKADQCCSKYGYCGTSSAHCDIGCQIGYGICSSSKLSPTTTTTTKKATITKNKTTIKGSTTTIKKSTTTLRSVSTVSGRCGPEYGACAKEDQCCSKYGYCGTSSAHCDIGCQIGYGKCNKTSNEAAKTTKKASTKVTSTKKTSTKITSTKKTSTKKTSTKITSTKKTSTKKTSTKKTSTKKITNKTTSTKRAIATVSGRCGIKYGGACAEAGLCCSKYDYCGSSSAHCGVGCQSAFGVCK